jgi:hypothetical protein
MAAAVSLCTARHAAKHPHTCATDAQTTGLHGSNAGEMLMQVFLAVAKPM